MIEISDCPCCKEGKLAFRLCANRETVVILCDQCAMVWVHPARLGAEQARDPLSAEFARQHPGVQLRTSRWASPEEVAQWGWGAYLMKPSDLTQAAPDQEKNTETGS